MSLVSSSSSVRSSPYRLELVLGGLPRSTNAARHAGGQWQRYAHDTEWKERVWALVPREKMPPAALKKYRLTCWRHSSSAPDYDGLVSCFKVVIDALVELRVLENDTLAATGQWDCRWQHAPNKLGFVRVIVEEEVNYAAYGL
jgi:hypothetical protein